MKHSALKIKFSQFFVFFRYFSLNKINEIFINKLKMNATLYKYIMYFDE